MTFRRISLVDIAKNTQVTLEVGYKIVPTSGNPETLLVSLLHTNETVLVFRFVNEERNQGPRSVAGSTPYLSTRKKGTS
jgi:hypothetical protein